MRSQRPMSSSAQRRTQVAAELAHYLGVGLDERFPRLELRRDLGLEPLDLVVFVLALEEAQGVAFAFEELESAVTVAELVEIVGDWLAEYDDAERLADADDPFGKESGAWRYTRLASND